MNVEVGDLPASNRIYPMQGKTIDFDGIESRKFIINFSAKNGFFEQVLLANRVEGELKFATIVKRGEDVLYERIDSGFPRNSEGTVEW